MTHHKPSHFVITRGPLEGKKAEIVGKFLRRGEQMARANVEGMGSKFVFHIGDLKPLDNEPIWRR
jgi:hypothetical protein